MRFNFLGNVLRQFKVPNFLVKGWKCLVEFIHFDCLFIFNSVLFDQSIFGRKKLNLTKNGRKWSFRPSLIVEKTVFLVVHFDNWCDFCRALFFPLEFFSYRILLLRGFNETFFLGYLFWLERLCNLNIRSIYILLIRWYSLRPSHVYTVFSLGCPIISIQS